MRKIFLFLILLMTVSGSFAQLDVKYWNGAGYFDFGGGMVFPGSEMKSTAANGLFAKNGFQVYANLNFMIIYGLGAGVNIEYDKFFLNKAAFSNSAQTSDMTVQGGYSSTKFGLNILMNIPLIVSQDRFAVNFYGEFNPGLRSFNIPGIDLYYDENVNKYVEVHYRSRKNTMGYLGYSAGLQFLFSNKWGINLSYNTILRSRYNIDYSVRKFDAFGNLYESENYINNYLDHSGVQLGLMFLFRGKRQK